MRIIVAGCGIVGSQLASLLSSEGHDVVVISRDPASFSLLGPSFDGITVAGRVYDQATLERAGIQSCDAFAAVTDEDNVNMMAAEVASQIFKVSRIVALLQSTEREETMRRLGLPFVCGREMVAKSLRDELFERRVPTLAARGRLRRLMGRPDAGGD